MGVFLRLPKPIIVKAFFYIRPAGAEIFFIIQINVPFKIISAHMRQANQQVGQNWENPEKNHMARPQAELALSHMCPVWGSNPHQT